MATLGELIRMQRERMVDEPVGVRRSWEDVFRFTLKHYAIETPVDEFDLQVLGKRLALAGMHASMVKGYLDRWQLMFNAEGRRQR